MAILLKKILLKLLVIRTEGSWAVEKEETEAQISEKRQRGDQVKIYAKGPFASFTDFPE